MTIRGNGKELFLQIDEKPTSSVYLTVVLHCYNPSNGLTSWGIKDEVAPSIPVSMESENLQLCFTI